MQPCALVQLDRRRCHDDLGSLRRRAFYPIVWMDHASKSRVAPCVLCSAAWDGSQWTELARHLIGCGGGADLRFALPFDIDDNASNGDIYLYYGNPNAGAPASAEGTAVYLWWDPATSDHGAGYMRGRMDVWVDTGYDNSLAWNSQGYYMYDTQNNNESSYRRAVDERDVLVEVSLYHTGCYTQNMQTGVCTRGIIQSGSGKDELSDHY